MKERTKWKSSTSFPHTERTRSNFSNSIALWPASSKFWLWKKRMTFSLRFFTASMTIFIYNETHSINDSKSVEKKKTKQISQRKEHSNKLFCLLHKKNFFLSLWNFSETNKWWRVQSLADVSFQMTCTRYVAWYDWIF